MESIKTASVVILLLVACAAAFYAGSVQNRQMIAELDQKITKLQQEKNNSLPTPILAQLSFNTSIEGELIAISDYHLRLKNGNGKEVTVFIGNSTRIAKSTPLSQEEYQKIRQDFDAWLAGNKQNDSSFPEIEPPVPLVDVLVNLSELNRGDIIRASSDRHIGDVSEFVAIEIRLIQETRSGS